MGKSVQVWLQSNLPVPGPAAIVCDSSKGEKKKDKFASLKPLQTWNFLPPCSVVELAMASPSCSSLAAVTAVLTVGSWKESALQPQQPWLLAVLTQERGAGAALARRCLQLLQSWAPWTSNADPSPEAALAGPQDHHPPALGQRTSRT